MLSSTISILHHLVTKKRRMQFDNINFNREKDFVKSVLTMDLWFIVCLVPICIMDLLKYIVSEDVLNSYYWNTFHEISALLCVMDASLNFFVLLVCNKNFRKEFKSIVSCARLIRVTPS